MSAILVALAAGASVALTYLARRRAQAREISPERAREPAGAAKPAAEKPAALPGLPFQLGDVVVVEGDERWLSGALVARESGRLHAALFFAPEGRDTRAVLAFPEPAREIFWLSPVDVASPDEPPATLQMGDLLLSRRGRRPVAIERLGKGAPTMGESALWAVYEAGGRDVGLVVGTGAAARGWLGRRLEEGEYESFGAGEVD